LQKVTVGDAENFDPSLIIENLKGRRDYVEKCIELYRDKPCSLWLFANSVGLTEFDAVMALAQYPNGMIKCSQTSPQEFEHATNESTTAKPIVLGLATIITLTITDAWKMLDPGKRFLVSQLTSEMVDAWIFQASSDQAKEGGTIAVDDTDHLIFRKTTSQERAARLDQFRVIRKNLDDHCELVSSVTIAELAPERRKRYAELIGMHNLEAISVANDRSAVLWIDDLVAGFVAKTDFGVPTVWTQLALRRLVTAGSVLVPDFDLVSAKLAAWNYVTIIWNPATIIAAGIEAKWDVNGWPLRECLALIEKAGLPLAAKSQIVAEFLQLLRRSNCSELKQSAVIQAALNALGDTRAVRFILQGLDQIFGLDIQSAEFVRLELVYWLRLR
jgi:hypothetical protein